MKITNSDYTKVILLTEKMVKKNLMKKAYSYKVWSRATENV